MSERFRVPDIKGMKIDNAIECLEDNCIKYNKDYIYKVTLFKKRGTVLKTDPEIGKKVSENKEIDIYVSRFMLCPFFLLFLFLIPTILWFNLGRSNLDYDAENSPYIVSEKEGWVQSNVVYVSKDASLDNIKYYEYCVRQDDKKNLCEWNRTDTKNAEITTTGIWNVWFRAVNDKTTSKLSNMVTVYIDNDSPIINEVTSTATNNSIHIDLSAKDNTSKIVRVEYNVNGGEFIDVDNWNNGFDINDLNPNTEYTICIRVYDEANNMVSTCIKATTSDSEENKIDKLTPPIINLDKIPSIIEYQDEYELPSYVWYPNEGGTTVCTVDGLEYTNTKDLFLGNQTIKCSATDVNGLSASVEKTILVKYKSEDPDGMEAQDGWIWLTLYYPAQSTEWQYEIRNPKMKRTYKDGWQPYTGPILVHVDDVRNVYIKYLLDGVPHIKAPNGRNLISIEPDEWAVEKGQKTKVTIYYADNAQQKLYKINKGPWQPYTGEFEVGPDTYIYAKAIGRSPVYDGEGNLLVNKITTDEDEAYITRYIPNPTRPGHGPGPGEGGGPGPGEGGGEECLEPDCEYDPNGPKGPGGYPHPGEPEADDYLAGPNISAYPSSVIVDSTTVSITTEYPARKIMYSINNGAYKEYDGSFTIDYNCVIKAYYIRDEDGMTSDISKYRIKTIKKDKLPYISIDANPDTLNKEEKETLVTITTKDAKTIEYSLDGIVYVPYTGAFKVYNSCTVYAHATNDFGDTYEQYTIMLVNPPTVRDKLSIKISGDPANNFSLAVDEITVTIDYDSRATTKQYKIGEDGEIKNYEGPFKINKNTTIYAYASSAKGAGYKEKMFDYTTQGISDPIINVTPNTAAQMVKVSIDYDQRALVTQYRYGSMDWTDYTGSFYVDENTIIYARNINADGEVGKARKKINNIVSIPNYRVLDKGDYLIIYINYPESSPENTREYKWKVDGTWKTYNPNGILLIKPGVNIDKTEDGYLVEDENNKKILFKDHYYFLERGLDEINEYLFARWGDGNGTGPSFVTNTNEVAPVVEVGILYREHDVKKMYRIVDEDGPSDWMEYQGTIMVDKAGTTIYAKSMTAEGSWSDVSNITINNVDNKDPVISLKGDLNKPVDELPIKVNVTDNTSVQLVGWARGAQEIPYFWQAGNFINPGDTVTITENGKYTFYAMDGVGREVIQIVDIQNVGKNPKITINTPDWKTSKTVSIHYHENLTNQYSLDFGSTWQNYTGPITLDNQTVVLARSLEDNVVVGNASFNVYKIDVTTPTVSLDIPDEVLLNSDHPVPTAYTVNNNLSGGDVVCKDEKNREITNLDRLGTGEHTVMCTVTTGAGNKASARKTFHVVRNLYSVDYYCTGDVQEWTAPVNGLYKFNAYGAQGGSTENAEGGKGGYVNGTISLYEGDTFYIYVGCAGTSDAAGYNGGGSENAGGASGGGASHIATSNLGELYNYENNKDDIIMVAGAGGGAGSKEGGAGGNNPTAGKGYYGTASKPGSLTAGGEGGNNAEAGSFGKGGSITSQYTDHVAGAGGAGFYGGGAGGFGSPTHASQDGYGGAGGSNYASSRLGNVKHETGVKYDDGYVKITLLDQYEKETPTFGLGQTHLDIDTEMTDIVNTLTYNGDGNLSVTSSDPDIVSVYLDEDDNIILNPGTKVGDATITVNGSRSIIYKEGEQQFTVNNKFSPFFNVTLDESASGINKSVYNYEYIGPGSISLSVNNTTYGNAVLHENASTTDANGTRHSSGTITVTAKSLGELIATIQITGDNNFASKKIVKRYTFTDPTEVTSSNDTAFQTALTDWGTIAKAGNNHNWYGTNSTTDTHIVDRAKGDYVIVETVNTTEWTGYYYQYKDPETGKYVIPQYKYTELDFDMTSSDGDDDAMGAMIRFNPLGFNATTGTNNVNFTGYILLMDNHANTGTTGTGTGGSSGYNNGNSNGIWKSAGKQFSTTCVGWSGTNSCSRLSSTNRGYWWTRNKWQHYKFIADGSSFKVYRWNYNANGTYTIGSGSTLLYQGTDSTYQTGTYGFWTESQAYAQFKNFKAITRDIDGYRITEYDA